MEFIKGFFNLPFGTHIVIGTIIRLFLILYGQYQDEVSLVPYTDVDYKVFTDAARHILMEESPYMRHTYRYTPLLALLLTPNVYFNVNSGKLMFSMFDILLGIAIKSLVKEQKSNVFNGKVHASKIERIASHSALFWIYNPFSIVIATRGNADSLASFLVIISLLFYETDIAKGAKKYFISGVFLGLAIHFRLYPIVFSLPMYMALRNFKITRKTNVIADIYKLVVPNLKQLNLVIGCVATLIILTVTFYRMYGYEFLFETYIYHILRKDTRHNFSVYFYFQYLTAEADVQSWHKMIPLLFLIICFGFRYGRPSTLHFALLLQAITIVAYNSVLTSQYFIWFLALLPLCISDFKMSARKAVVVITIWALTQGSWLFYAYLLEFEGKNVFYAVWLQSVGFFCANIYLLVNLIRSYSPGHIKE